MALRSELEKFFGGRKGRRVVLVGIGSPIRHDDVVGLRVLELLEGKTPKDVLLISTETVPESYTGVIRDFSPTHVLLLDAAHFSGSPGEGRIIPSKSIANVLVSTHSLPLNIFVDYLKRSICDNVILLGIQGVNIDLGEGLTPEVEDGAKSLTDLLSGILNE
jgi:hydrogenase 3 maturation protease